jgi:membrane protease YdiL (CAAX protease family)
MNWRGTTTKVLTVFFWWVLLVSIVLWLIIWFTFPGIDIEQLTLQQFTGTMLLQHVFFLGVLLVSLMVYVGKEGWFSHLKKRRQRKWWWYMRKYVVGWRLLYLLWMIVIGAVMQNFGREIPWFNGEQWLVSIFEWFALGARRQYLVMFLLISIITPLVEESIYRTFLTDLLSQHGSMFWVVAGAFIFAASHLEIGVFVNLFILGLILGYIYHKTKSWWYPFFFHLIINSMSLLFLFLV